MTGGWEVGLLITHAHAISPSISTKEHGILYVINLNCIPPLSLITPLYNYPSSQTTDSLFGLLAFKPTSLG